MGAAFAGSVPARANLTLWVTKIAMPSLFYLLTFVLGQLPRTFRGLVTACMPCCSHIASCPSDGREDKSKRHPFSVSGLWGDTLATPVQHTIYYLIKWAHTISPLTAFVTPACFGQKSELQLEEVLLVSPPTRCRNWNWTPYSEWKRMALWLESRMIKLVNWIVGKIKVAAWCGARHLNQAFLYDAFFNGDQFLTPADCLWFQAKSVESRNYSALLVERHIILYWNKYMDEIQSVVLDPNLHHCYTAFRMSHFFPFQCLQ